MTDMNLFKKTRLPHLQQALENDFANSDPLALFKDACSILRKELGGMEDRGSKVVGKHLAHNILPGYACYKALLNAGIQSQTATEFVKQEMCKSAQPMGDFCEKLSDKPYVYGLFRVLFDLGMKFGYPKEGWTVVLREKTKRCVRFDITTCLYCEELTKRNALELCPAFCQTDHTSYDPLAPGVLFKRKGTLAQGNAVCDFCFEKGSQR